MNKGISGLVAFLGLAAAPAFAHGGGAHMKGTVAAIASDHVTVKGLDGHDADASITPATRFVRGKAAGKREDVKEGDRVVVHTRARGDKLEAVEIRYGARTKAANK